MNRIIQEKINGYSKCYSILDNRIRHSQAKENNKNESKKQRLRGKAGGGSQ